jgi:hypothetical protein
VPSIVAVVGVFGNIRVHLCFQRRRASGAFAYQGIEVELQCIPFGLV